MAGVTGRGDGTYIDSNVRFGSKPSTVASAHLIWPALVADQARRDPNSGDYVQVAAVSASDTASGAGARRVTLTGVGYVNANSKGLGFRSYQESIWLNGTTPATSTYQYIGILNAWCDRGATNVGSIFIGYGTFTNGVPANIQAQISAGEGESEQLTGCLPSSVEGHVHNISFHIGKDGGGQNILGTFRFLTQDIVQKADLTYETGPWRVRYVAATIDDALYQTDVDALKITGPVNIKIDVNASGTGARATAQIVFELHKKLQ